MIAQCGIRFDSDIINYQVICRCTWIQQLPLLRCQHKNIWNSWEQCRAVLSSCVSYAIVACQSRTCRSLYVNSMAAVRSVHVTHHHSCIMVAVYINSLFWSFIVFMDWHELSSLGTSTCVRRRVASVAFVVDFNGCACCATRSSINFVIAILAV